MAGPGRLLGLGVGPGDPELITVKALRLLRAAPVIGYLSAKAKKSNAFSIIEAHVRPEQTLLPMIYPVTTEHLPAPFSYDKVIADFSGGLVVEVGDHLVVREGDRRLLRPIRR